VIVVNYKIFIGLTEIAGYYSNLKKGFQKIGVESSFINLSSHPFKYGGDDVPNIFVKLHKQNNKKIRKYKSKIVKAPFYLLNIMLKIPIFIWAFHHHNVFIFGFSGSFFNYFDLPILKYFNKKIIFVFNGSDERPPYIDGARHNLTISDYKRITSRMKSNIVCISKYADYIVGSTNSSHFHQKSIINFVALGLPFNHPSDNNYVHGKTRRKGIRILHAPSDPIGKGSDRIRSSISELKRKEYDIEYIEITGRPHHEVIKELQNCDFIVDQVYGGPMAGFATEAAYFGKPNVAGGYYADYIHNDYFPEHIPPSLYCHPDNLTSAIERLIVDEEYRLELGKRAQEFVRTRWAPEQVARRYLQIIEGTIPEEYMFDPNTIRYVQGYGMPESKSKEIIRNMIEQYGIESLCLSDKPELEQRFRDYAYDNLK